MSVILFSRALGINGLKARSHWNSFSLLSICAILEDLHG